MPSGCVFPFEQRLRGALPTQLVQTGHVTSRHVVYAVYSGCNAVQFFFPSGWKQMSGTNASGPNSPSANMFTYHFLSTYFFVLFFAVHLRHIFSQQLLACQNSPFANRVFLCIPLSTIFDTARWAGAFCATMAMPVRFARSARNARSARLFDSRQSLSLLVKRHEELKSSVTFGQSVGVTFSRTLHRGSHFYLLASWPHRPC